MQLPFFFEEKFPDADTFVLSEETSKHIVQVLRMKKTDELRITNGKGEMLTASIIIGDKKKTQVQIKERLVLPPESVTKISIAISLIKNASRFEWFLEKVTEIGINEIIPFISERTEKQHFRFDRMKSILVSAMLQSQQAWLPKIHEPVKFKELIKKAAQANKYIAHCVEDKKLQLKKEVIGQGDTLLLIGPEGDFTKDEIEDALRNNFIQVSLGETRLRTETAGVVAAVLLLNK
jgi:16S rRNA (uracil1498-N3)-methyltransferase